MHESYSKVIWKKINQAGDYLEYAKLMSETFGSEFPASSLSEEVNRELCENHPLKSAKFNPFYYRSDNPNEFIFKTNAKGYSYVLIHLTWKQETSLLFPRIEKISLHDITVEVNLPLSQKYSR